MKTKEFIKRYITFIIGLFFIGMGIAFTRHGELGVSPISSVANILSYKFTFFSIGNWLIITNTIFIITQFIILKSKFELYQLLQLPISVLSGFFTDICLKLISDIPNDIYIMQLVTVMLGIITLALGISLTITANIIMCPAEALVKVISDTANKNFGKIKIIFDVCWVLFSVILSLILFDFKIIATREGTLIAAVLTGYVARIFINIIKPMENFLKG